ncbi:MAG: hypothetical protein PVG92_07115 [Holophagae bacterium]|jgi:type IV pilus assembly protein PilN
MIAPNLATRPFLNNRPVWLVTAVAATLALVLVGLNLRLHMVAARNLGTEIARRDVLRAQVDEIDRQLRVDTAALEKVPWRSLERRVEATNMVLREHAFSWLVMLDDIEQVMPYDVRLTRISPNVKPEGVNLTFEVVARNRDAMLQLIDNLIADPQFEEPQPSAERSPEETSSGVYMLSLRVLYLQPGADS